MSRTYSVTPKQDEGLIMNAITQIDPEAKLAINADFNVYTINLVRRNLNNWKQTFHEQNLFNVPSDKTWSVFFEEKKLQNKAIKIYMTGGSFSQITDFANVIELIKANSQFWEIAHEKNDADFVVYGDYISGQKVHKDWDKAVFYINESNTLPGHLKLISESGVDVNILAALGDQRVSNVEKVRSNLGLQKHHTMRRAPRGFKFDSDSSSEEKKTSNLNVSDEKLGKVVELVKKQFTKVGEIEKEISLSDEKIKRNSAQIEKVTNYQVAFMKKTTEDIRNLENRLDSSLDSTSIKSNSNPISSSSTFDELKENVSNLHNEIAVLKSKTNSSNQHNMPLEYDELKQDVTDIKSKIELIPLAEDFTLLKADIKYVRNNESDIMKRLNQIEDKILSFSLDFPAIKIPKESEGFVELRDDIDMLQDKVEDIISGKFGGASNNELKPNVDKLKIDVQEIFSVTNAYQEESEQMKRELVEFYKSFEIQLQELKEESKAQEQHINSLQTKVITNNDEDLNLIKEKSVKTEKDISDLFTKFDELQERVDEVEENVTPGAVILPKKKKKDEDIEGMKDEISELKEYLNHFQTAIEKLTHDNVKLKKAHQKLQKEMYSKENDITELKTNVPREE